MLKDLRVLTNLISSDPTIPSNYSNDQLGIKMTKMAVEVASWSVYLAGLTPATTRYENLEIGVFLFQLHDPWKQSLARTNRGLG